MAATVTLKVVEGPSKGAEYAFSERTVAIVGRSDDCDPKIDEQGPPFLVSRHHCLFDINPPDVRVRDFGSLNGTHVNGDKIGAREEGQTPEQGAQLAFREVDLVDGDRVALGETVVQVGVVAALDGRAQGSVPAREDLGLLVAEILALAGGGRPDLVPIDGYTVRRKLGEGAQGAVYLATHESSGEQVALKVMVAKVAVDDRAREEFLREIVNIQAQHHPNVVDFRSAGSSGGAFFFTSEYCAGGSVDDLMRRRGSVLTVDESVSIVLQALAGLGYAHTVFLGSAGAIGLVHRDIKPANILLTSNGPNPIAKIGDFGLAKAFDRAGLSGHTMTGAVAGTVGFMSRPQLVNYKYAKPPVDVWSMAASLYWMLTGTTAREFPERADPIGVVLGRSAVPIRERDPRIPPRLAKVIDTALIDNPRIEVTSAAEFAAGLRDSV